MKKYIFAISAALAIMVGCTKENNTENVYYGNSLVFTASIQTTKTTISDGSKLLWQDGDQVSINGILYKAVVDEAAPASATLVRVNAADPDPEPVEGIFTAVYPATLAATEGLALPAVQTYNADCDLSGVNPMYAESADTELSFSNLCGLFEFNIEGEESLASIEISDSALGLSGAFTVVDNAAVLTEAAAAAAAGVTLDCGEEGVSLSGTPSFYVAVPAGEYSGLTIKLTAVDGKEQTITLKAGTTATIERNTVYPVSFKASFSAPAALSGIFSVSATKTVKFAKGNLFFDGTGWAVERNQYSSAEDWSTDHVSLFTWTDNAYGSAAAYTATTSTTVDWGAAYCESNSLASGTWRTLSSDEWNYILNLRPVAEGQARFTNTVNTPVTIDGIACSGLFIYPDAYEGEAVSSSFTWKTLADAGIVFLPAAGSRDGSDVSWNGQRGYYWASDSINSKIAYNLTFGVNYTQGFNAYGRDMGYSVRLVTE